MSTSTAVIGTFDKYSLPKASEQFASTTVLLVDPADALDRADEVRVLAQQVARLRRLDMGFGIGDSAPMHSQQSQVSVGEHAPVGHPPSRPSLAPSPRPVRLPPTCPAAPAAR